MADPGDQWAIQDRQRFPALTAHKGTAGTAQVQRVVATPAGDLKTSIASGTINTLGTVGVLNSGTITSVQSISAGTINTLGTVGVLNSGTLNSLQRDSGLEIARGNVPGVSYIHKFGNAPDFDAADGYVTVWDGAEDGVAWENMVYDYSTSADITSLTSDVNGDGQNIEIQGLDTNLDQSVQTITLTGTATATLGTALKRVFRLKNQGVTNNAGHVFCFVGTAQNGSGIPSNATDVRAIMQPGNNQTLMAVYTIPNGKTGYMRSWYASTAGASRTSDFGIQIRARSTGGVFQLKHVSSLIETGSTHLQHQYAEPEKFSAKTDIEMRMSSLTSGVLAASTSAGFDFVLIDN